MVNLTQLMDTKLDSTPPYDARLLHRSTSSLYHSALLKCVRSKIRPKVAALWNIDFHELWFFVIAERRIVVQSYLAGCIYQLVLESQLTYKNVNLLLNVTNQSIKLTVLGVDFPKLIDVYIVSDKVCKQGVPRTPVD